ncbi:MAG: hypothetical protein HFJ86_11730 [Oscillospiraceae bacterium]|jgi:hypothetical protein|nr:hypothetical protein [Oscillospiraceae bacterium]MCI8351812.1 hypothetical protein [Oscillospiraceae bacterium]
MILQFLAEPLIALAEFLVGLFPAFPRFDSLAVTLDPVAYVIRFMDLFVSMKTVSRCLLVILIVYNIKFGWSILMWIIRKIPGVS